MCIHTNTLTHECVFVFVWKMCAICVCKWSGFHGNIFWLSEMIFEEAATANAAFSRIQLPTIAAELSKKKTHLHLTSIVVFTFIFTYTFTIHSCWAVGGLSIYAK